jgi:hypothetical protein
MIFFFKLGEIVRETQICNLFDKIQPQYSIKIKTNNTAVRGKNPEKIVDFKTSIS